MTAIELLNMLTDEAKEFRADHEHYQRNSHMHDIRDCPPQDVIDAVLTGFINAIGGRRGVDYALYSRDLATPTLGEE